MKRDLDLFRALLFEAEARDDPFFIIGLTNQAGPEDINRFHHVHLLCDAGLMVQTGKEAFRLTNAGHDFLEAVREDTRWTKTKDAAQAVGGLTLGVFRDIAVAYMKQEVAARLGISLP